MTERKRHPGPVRPDRRHRPHFSQQNATEWADRFPVPPSQAMPKRVFVLCHYCGYGPNDVPPGGLCPKCGGHSWERFALAEPLVPAHMK